MTWLWFPAIALAALAVSLLWGAIAARRDEATSLILHDGSRFSDQPDQREAM